MNRIRLLALVTILSTGLAAPAQSSEVPQNTAQEQTGQHSAVPNAKEHLRMLSESLNLTTKQQEKLRPIIQNMLDQRQKLLRDQKPR